MAIPLSNSPFQAVVQAEFDETIELISEIGGLIENEAEANIFPSNGNAALDGDSTTLRDPQTSSFISEQMMPMLAPLAQQALLNNGQLIPPKQQNVNEQASPHTTGATGPIEDKNITANYLFSLNPLQKVTAEMNKPGPRQSARRDVQDRDEVLQFLQPEPAEKLNKEADLGPMIEAMTNTLPQVSIELPGGIELRIVINRNGNPTVMYVTPEGTLRTLPKGKTLRLNRWVNGIAFRTDGSIGLTP